MNKRKRVIAYVLCIALCLPMGLALPDRRVQAEETIEGCWNDPGNYTKNWIDPYGERDTYGNSGTRNAPFEIRNERDFAAFSEAVKEGIQFSNKYIQITADQLDMSKHYWYPIPESSSFFGNFDGNNCEIWNVTINTEKQKYTEGDIGLFGTVYGKIRNVKLMDIEYNIKNNYSCIGGLVTRARDSDIENCSVNGKILCTGEQNIHCGGLADCIENSIVKDCKVAIQVECLQNQDLIVCGGVIAQGNESKITGCNAEGTIKVKNQGEIGGITGTVEGSLVIEKCAADVDITAGDHSNAGGIIGKSYFKKEQKVSDTVAKGDISVGENSNAGGFFGSVDDYYGNETMEKKYLPIVWQWGMFVPERTPLQEDLVDTV